MPVATSFPSQQSTPFGVFSHTMGVEYALYVVPDSIIFSSISMCQPLPSVTPPLPASQRSAEGLILPSSANVRCAVTQVNLGARVCAYVCSNSYVDLEV